MTMNPAMGDYRPGSILRITLKNFMTHESAVVEPGPRLNMVLGANGTGKSTILNAICLGLGGSPKILGRADDLRAFVMHGKDVAKIEIELATEDGRKLVLLRTIDRRKGSEKGRGKASSTFYINDEKVKIEQVQELVQKLMIQIDNLCTFLPQEKVGSFSGLTDTDRLLETEKTISMKLHDRHLELIKLEESVSTDASQLDTLKEALKRKEAELNRLNLDRAREEERVKAEQTLDLLQKKILWLIFEELRDKTVEAKHEKDQAKKELQAALKEVQPLESKLDEIKAYRQKLDVKSRQLDESVLETKKEMEKQKKKFELQDDEIERTCLSIGDIDTIRDTRQREYDEAVEKLTELETKSADMDPKEAHDKFEHAKNSARVTKRELDSAKREFRAIEAESRENEDRAKQLQTKLARLSDDATLRRDKIFSNNANLKKIYDWVQENRGRFRRSVFGPIAAEINATKFANCLEYHVPFNILSSFVCELREDQDLLYKHIRSEMGIPVNIVCVENSSLDNTRPYSDRQMNEFKSRHGVLGYLDEMFTCADPVMIALQNFARVHKVLVGGDKSQDSIDNHGLRDLISKTQNGQNQGSCIFTTKGGRTFQYTQMVSKYSNMLSSREEQCGDPRMLAPGVDPMQKEAVENELNQAHAVLNEQRPKVAEIKKRVTDLDSAARESHLAAEGAKKDYDDIRKYQTRVERQRDRVKEKELLLQADDASDRKDLVKKLLQRWRSSVTCVEAHGDEHEQMMQNTTQNAGIVIQMNVLKMREAKVQDDIDEKAAAKVDAENKYRAADSNLKKAKDILRKHKDRAENEARLIDEHGNDLPLKAVLDTVEVDSVDEARLAIEDAKEKVTAYAANPEVIKMYEKLKDEVTLLRDQVETTSSAQGQQAGQIQKKCDTFLAELGGKLTDVDGRFSAYMAEMGCTGTLRLKKGGEEGNEDKAFKNWGLEILVSFREGSKAQVLSAQRHSGGERSVSTIMFLMALQDLMVAPFRTVDEINQGLDDRNERLVFRRIVKNSTAPPGNSPTDHSGQYFLITPKLLPNLTDMENEAMTILFVFNGPHIFETPTQWKQFLESKAAADLANDDVENQEANHGTGSVPRHSKKKRLS